MTVNPTISNVPHSVIESQISIHFALQTAVFEMHRMTPTWPWTPQGQMYLIYVLHIYSDPSLKFHSTTSRFQEIQAILRQVHRMTPKWPRAYSIKCTPYVLLVSPSLKFHSVSVYGQPFSSYNPFEESAQTDPQMTLNPTRSKVPHIRVTSVPESQITLRFAIRPAVFEIEAILRQVDRMTSIWPWTLQGQRYPTYELQIR